MKKNTGKLVQNYSYLAFGTFALQILGFCIVFLDACFDFRKRFPSEWSESRAFVVSLKNRTHLLLQGIFFPKNKFYIFVFFFEKFQTIL